MKLKYILFLFYFSFSAFSFAQAPQKIWDKTLGGSGYESTPTILSTPSGETFIIGWSDSNLSHEKSENSKGSSDIWVVKLNSNGVKIWDKTIGSASFDNTFSAIIDLNGNIIIAARSSGYISGDKTENSKGGIDYWVVKIDTNGQKLWDKTIGSNSDDYISSMCLTQDGGYILCGLSSGGIGGDKTESGYGGDFYAYDIWIVKLSASGAKIWDKTIGTQFDENEPNISNNMDNSFTIVSSSDSPISGNKTANSKGSSDFWIIKFNTNGQILWDKTIGGSNNDSSPMIVSTNDGGNIISGISSSSISYDKTENSKGSNDFWIVKMNANGQKIWDKTIGGSEAENNPKVLIKNDGSLIIVGESISPASGDKSEYSKGVWDYWIIKLNSDNQKDWDKTIGGNYFESFSSSGHNIPGVIISNNDGSVIIAGESQSDISGDKSENNRGERDFWIVKLGIENTSIIKLSQSPIFSGGIPELTTGKTYNLEFGLKNTGTTPWQGDIYWKLNNGTYRLSNSNISIPVGASGVFTTSYSPTTSEVGNNLPVAIYTKTTGSGVYDLAGVVNGTQNPISINIKLPSTAVEKAIPFIRLDKAEYLPGEVVRVTGGNFMVGENVSFETDIKTSSGLTVNIPAVVVQSDGRISTTFTIPSLLSPKDIMSVSVFDLFGYVPKVQALIKNQQTSNIKIIKPYKVNNTIVVDANGYTNIEFTDKILPWFQNTLVSATKRNYQYNIGYKLDGSSTIINLMTTPLKEAMNYVTITERILVQMPLAQFHVGVNKNITFVISDAFNNQRLAESPLQTIQVVNSTIKVSQKWDKSFDKSIASDPTGIAADGVARMYLVAEKASATGSTIQSVSVSLTSNDGANDAEWVGKIKFASTQNNNTYSEEANGITTTTASSGTSLSQYWFWYVAPDDFMRNGMPYSNESERVVNVNFTITFLDGSMTSKTHKITVVRPPVMLVHGLGGSSTSTWDTFPLRNSPIFKQIEALDMYPMLHFNINAAALIGKDASKHSSSFQYQLQKMREKGYACNQVDYVCHSMGGSIFRAVLDNFKPFYYQSGTQINNPNKTYGQGFANKFITLDTPHNGSPWGDLISNIAPILPLKGRVALTAWYNLYMLDFQYTAALSPFIIPQPESLNSIIYEFEATGAVENLQVIANNGGVDFKELSGIPSHLIAGDVVAGNDAIPNMENSMLDVENYNKYFKLFYHICDYIADNKRTGTEPAWLDAFMDYVETNNPAIFEQIQTEVDKAKTVTKVMEMFCLFSFRYNNIFVDGDIIVPLISQTAGFISGNHISVLNDNPIDLGKFHINITEDNSAANRIKLLLNESTNSTYFTLTIPANTRPIPPTSGGGGGSFRLSATQNTAKKRPFVESFDKTKIEIVSPTTLSNLKVGQNIAVKVNVKDLAYLKRVELVFQSNIYGDTLINSSYNFYPNVETSMLGKQLIVATATYVKNDSVFLKMDTLSVNIMTDETVEVFRATPKYKNIGLDEKFIPNYNVGYGKFITHYVDKSKLAVNISNSSVINYDNVKGRFVGLQKGESQIIFTYESKKDTIYIAVADGGAAYTSAITTGTITNTTVCPGGILQVPYTTTGTFGVGNEFLIQISDLTGENFQTLETTAGSNLATYLPKNLKAGSYKVRVISTNDPIIGTVSSSTIVVQKYSNPPTLVASKTTFVEGERITLTGSGCPASFQFAHTPFYSFTNGTPITVSPLTDTKIECFCVNSNNTCYSESATPIYLTKEVCSPNKSIIYSSGVINNEGDSVNIEETSDYITSVNKLNTSNTYNEYHAGKYVLLNSGFEVKGGSTFKASINGCNNTNTSNLLGYYPFNFYGIEESGNNKTIFYSQGYYTGGQRFSLVAGKNGQNKAISIDSSPVSAFSNLYQLSPINQSSYSFWVKTNVNIDNTNSKYAVISQTISSSTPLSFTVGYETTDGSYYCEIANSSANKVGKKVIMPNNNQWTHIVVTFKYAPAIANFPLTSSDFSIYVNGVKSTGTSNILSVGIGGTEINNYVTGNYQFFNYSPTNTTFLGQFDDFRLYDKALTDAEVLQIYNSEKP